MSQNTSKRTMFSTDVLPEGWSLAQLGQIITFRSGDFLPKTAMVEGNVSVFGGNGISGFHNEANVFEPTIVVGRVGALCGNVHVTPDSAWVTDNAFVVSFSQSNLDQEFLVYLLRAAELRRESSSTAQPVISGRKVYPIEIPIPPLAEQRRIVAKVEELLAEVNSARDRLAKVPAILKRFRQSVLAAACSGRLTEDWREKNPHIKNVRESLEQWQKKIEVEYQQACVKAKANGQRKPTKPTCLDNFEFAWDDEDSIPDNWAIVPLGNGCAKITDGTHDTPKPVGKGVPYITAKHIRTGVIDFQNSLFLPKNEHEVIFARCNPERGDVLVVNIGAGTATPAFVDVDVEFSLKNVALLKPIQGALHGRYLEYHQMWIHPTVFEVVSRGGAQPFMGLNLIKTIPLRLPPLDEQQEIVNRVKDLFLIAERIEDQIEHTKTIADSVPQSILAKAFRGELVPTESELAQAEGRDYEPASVLLERIQVARVAKKPKKQSKKGRKSGNKRKTGAMRKN